ncbi:MAG: hypothetical protein AAF908_12145 [Pseudomonadota bacterium]
MGAEQDPIAAWSIVPNNMLGAWGLTLVFLYLFYRHFFLVLMFMDIVLGWLRRFRWFPKKGRRLRTLVHWLIAVGMFAGYVALSNALGWLEVVPK